MKAYIGLGTNLGRKEENLYAAVRLIEQRIGTICSLSAFYETAPWGFSSTHSFLNAACSVVTTLAPLELLRVTQEIERDLGRLHKSTNGIYSDRLIDIDLLLCDDFVVRTPDLILPHPLMTERRFVLEPLAEIAPDAVHPVLRKTIADCLNALSTQTSAHSDRSDTHFSPKIPDEA